MTVLPRPDGCHTDTVTGMGTFYGLQEQQAAYDRMI